MANEMSMRVRHPLLDVKTQWTLAERYDSSDDNVKKFVFTKEDAVAEAVLYKYPTYEDRTVICCSTQSGCPVGCRFCGAGNNFIRSLTSPEIIAQVEHVLHDQHVDAEKIKSFQIMFMSMGEPLLNHAALMGACMSLDRLHPNAKLLISTSAPRVPGVYEKIRHLSAVLPQIGLQFSIHETTDEARNKLIPFKRKLTLAEIAEEGRLWSEATGRQPFFNYCVHEGNNTVADALRLWMLFPPSIWQATISVICEKDESVAEATSRQRDLALDFEVRLRSYGYSTRVFDPAGQDDIGGGCGQLWYVQKWMQDHPDRAHKSIGGMV